MLIWVWKFKLFLSFEILKIKLSALKSDFFHPNYTLSYETAQHNLIDVIRNRCGKKDVVKKDLIDVSRKYCDNVLELNKKTKVIAAKKFGINFSLTLTDFFFGLGYSITVLSFIHVGYAWQILGRGWGFSLPSPIREEPRKDPSWIGLDFYSIFYFQNLYQKLHKSKAC